MADARANGSRGSNLRDLLIIFIGFIYIVLGAKCSSAFQGGAAPPWCPVTLLSRTMGVDSIFVVHLDGFGVDLLTIAVSIVLAGLLFVRFKPQKDGTGKSRMQQLSPVLISIITGFVAELVAATATINITQAENIIIAAGTCASMLTLLLLLSLKARVPQYGGKPTYIEFERILLRYGYIITLLMVLAIDSIVALSNQWVMGGAGLFDGIIIWPAFTELVLALISSAIRAVKELVSGQGARRRIRYQEYMYVVTGRFRGPIGGMPWQR
ncbi:MAG: hypothetical protein ACP5RJ_08275 [Conexivisphaera sp.]